MTMSLQSVAASGSFPESLEKWIDLPGELWRGYRTFLYHRMAELQPETYFMMNNGVPDSTKYDYHYAFPSDLLAIERGIPPQSAPARKSVVSYPQPNICADVHKES